MAKRKSKKRKVSSSKKSAVMKRAARLRKKGMSASQALKRAWKGG